MTAYWITRMDNVRTAIACLALISLTLGVVMFYIQERAKSFLLLLAFFALGISLIFIPSTSDLAKIQYEREAKAIEAQLEKDRKNDSIKEAKVDKANRYLDSVAKLIIDAGDENQR